MNLSIARFRFDCVTTTPLRLPEYAGSALRGAFGHALKRNVCVTRDHDCRGCALYRSCMYPAIFEPPPQPHAIQNFSQIPSPYVIEPPDWGEKALAENERWRFHMVLMGHTLKHLPVIIHAWQSALACGVGPGDGRSRVLTVSICHPQGEMIVLDDARSFVDPAVPAKAGDPLSALQNDGALLRHLASKADACQAPRAPSSLTLRFRTPLRLQQEGRPLRPDQINTERLLISLVKRIALLHAFHGTCPLELDFSTLKVASQAIDSEKKLQWRDWSRHSNRQNRDMKLGGVVGDWTLYGDLAPFWPYLHLGQWLHVGKNASFGLGHYQILR